MTAEAETTEAPATAERPPAYAEERVPNGGIPAGDWLAAFQGAARELFGDQWEPQLARFLAANQPFTADLATVPR